MKLVRLIVFDLDGTLVDSRRDLADSANQILVESGGTPHSEESIGRMVGDGAATLVARVFDEAGLPQPADALARFLRVYNGRLLEFTTCYPGIPSVLSTLAQRATLAVLTNKPLGATQTILKGLDLARFFDGRVIGGDGPFPRKPDPAGLNHLIAGAAITPGEAVLVGDSVIDWTTAHAAAARSCVARYGFGFAGFPVGQLTSADRTIDSPQDLIGAL